jgi:hypothetical protein
MNRERRHTYAASLSWGGDEPTAELEVEVSFTVDWGSSESGRFGPPENYDPGCPSMVEDIRVEKIDGLPLAEWEAKSTEYMPGSTVAAILEKLEMDHEAEMLAEAAEAEVADADEAAERAYEDRRDAERIWGAL